MSQESPQGFSTVLKNRSFLFLWLAQALSQTAFNATIYVLLVRVEETTGSSTALGLLILSFILPSVLIGVAAGVFVDRWEKQRVLLITNLLRAIIVATFVLYSHSFVLVLLINLAYSVVSQFFLPAEISSIPVIVPRDQLILANGLFNLTLGGAQLAGFVIMGPILIKSLGTVPLFLGLAGVYVVCAGLVSRIVMTEPKLQARGIAIAAGMVRPVLNELREGWRLLAQDSAVSLSILHLTLMNALILIIGMLAPGYVSRVLGIQADDAVYIMAPAGVGMLAGIATLPLLASRWPKDIIANVGIFTTASVFFLLGVVGQLGHLPGAGLLPGFGLVQPPAEFWMILGVMVLALVLGYGYALVVASAQTLVQQRTPEELRGRVFATQFAFANAVAVVPLMFLGSLADLVGVSEVTLLGGLLMFVAGAFSASHTRRVRNLALELD